MATEHTIKLATGDSVRYWERFGSPTESYAGSTGKARRIFDVAWSDRLKFLAGMLGWSEPVYNANGTFKHIKRVPPVAYPPIIIPSNIPWMQGKSEANDYWLYATSVDSIEPVGIKREHLKEIKDLTPEDLVDPEIMSTIDDDDLFEYAKARITVSYESLPYRTTNDSNMLSLGFFGADRTTIDESWMWRYVSRTMQPNAEHLTLPFGVLSWAGDAPYGLAGQVATNQTGKIISTVEIVFTWHQVPGIPEQAFSMVGTINSNTIYDYSPGVGKAKTYAPGTLLFLGLELKTYRMATGTFANDVVYRFKHFSARDPNTGALYSPERGHNYFIAFNANPTPPNPNYSYEKLVGTGATNGVYQTADFSKLFTLPDLA